MPDQDVTREITYFRYCGEVNTEKLLAAAGRRCLELGVGQVVIASETGRSALRALESFAGLPVRLIVVTHPPAETWGPKGDIPIGLGRPEYAAVREKLVAAGVALVQGTRPLGPLSRSLGWDAPTPEMVIDRALGLFGAGTKIAIEVAVMATDAGAVAPGIDIVTCAGTFKGLDTALVVRTAYSWSFFADFEVREIVARPCCRVHRLPEHESAEWKGDLEAYYP